MRDSMKEIFSYWRVYYLNTANNEQELDYGVSERTLKLFTQISIQTRPFVHIQHLASSRMLNRCTKSSSQKLRLALVETEQVRLLLE